MPLKLSVGLSRKIGQPDFGSLGATCNMEWEANASLLSNDPEEFQSQVQQAYAACCKSVEDELARHSGESASKPANGNGHPSNQPHSTGNDATTRNGFRASDKQLNYARRLASQIEGLGRLELFVDRMLGKPMSDLTSLDASSLIDQLKAVKDGSVRLGDAGEGMAL